MKGHEVLEWNPVLAPAATPDAVRAKLSAAIAHAKADAAVQERVNRHAAEGQLVQVLYNQAMAEAQALEQAIKDEEAKKA